MKRRSASLVPETGNTNPPPPDDDLKAFAAGCLAFVGCVALGTIVSYSLGAWMIRDLPREDVPEALHADGIGIQWCCGGLYASVALGSAASWIVSRWVRERQKM